MLLTACNSKNYRGAEAAYTEAIEAWVPGEDMDDSEKGRLYANRGSTRMMLLSYMAVSRERHWQDSESAGRPFEYVIVFCTYLFFNLVLVIYFRLQMT